MWHSHYDLVPAWLPPSCTWERSELTPGDLVRDVYYSKSVGVLIAIDPKRYNDLRSKVLDAYVLWTDPPMFLQAGTTTITTLPGNSTVSTSTITVGHNVASSIPNFVTVVKKAKRKCRKKRH